MPTALLTDQDRHRFVVAQVGRMSPQAKTALMRALAGGDVNEGDPRDLDGQHQNVQDKGMQPPVRDVPPVNETPDINDDQSMQVPPQGVRTVEDKGLQQPIRDRQDRAAAQRAAQQRRQPARPPARVASSPDAKMFAALELAEKMVRAGHLREDQKVAEVQKIASTKSIEEIRAQSEVYSRTLTTQASRPLVPRPAGPSIDRPVSTARRAVAHQPSQEQVAEAEDETLMAIGFAAAAG